ncbi:MAG: PEP-CTERM sorting domain-containing protein [Verrucomicrobiales bacterium]|nr:PEP-CTERM sorting domain-containing protein [Verrucomicrobiales bacterium]
MKKSTFIAVLGMAACVASSYGQGTVNFSSYFGNQGAGFTTSLFGTTTSVPDGFHADLYFALGTGVTDSVNFNDALSVFSAPTGLTGAGVVGAVFSGGYFGNPIIPVSIAGYASGPVTYEVVVYNGADYASSSIRGRSGSFVLDPGAATTGNPIPMIDNVPNFFVANAIPEPTTLALAGLGGLASLVMLRRKNA